MLQYENCGALATDLWMCWASLLGVVFVAAVIIKDYRDHEAPAIVNWPEDLMAYVVEIVVQFIVVRFQPQPVPAQNDDDDGDDDDVWQRRLLGLLNWFRRPFRILVAIRGVRL